MNFSLFRTKSFFPKTAVLLGLLSFTIVSQIRAYDAPDFDYEIFSSDGLFLEEEEKESLLQILLAIATNSSKGVVDSDLKEKAIALALRIAPLHEPTRNAHSLLSKGKDLPSSTGKLQKTGEIASALWDIAEKLASEKAGPEASKLAVYLMDMSLTLYRTPPPKRLEYFAELTKFQLLPWKKFVLLQPDANPSSRKIGMMFSLLKMNGPTSEPIEEPSEKTPAEVKPAPPAPESALEQKFSSIPAIGFSDGPTAVGILHLNIRPWDPDKQDAATKAKQGIHIAGSLKKDGPHFSGFREISTLIRSRYKDWPTQSIGVFSLDLLDTSQKFSAQEKANISLPGMILADSVYTGKKVSHSIVFGGQLLTASDDTPPEIVPPGNSSELFEKAGSIKTPFLALPKSSYKPLLERVIALGSLEFIVKPQLLSFSDLDDAIKLSTSEPEEPRTKAEAAFQQIVAVSDKMSLEELSRNKTVQERLEKIVAEYPRHLSARIMLEFGKTKAP